MLPTKDDRLKFIQAIVASQTAEQMIAAVDKIWEDGYKTAEAEVTYSLAGRE
jgi:hypothetical protein